MQAVNCYRPSGKLVMGACLIGFNPCQLKVPIRGWASMQNLVVVLCEGTWVDDRRSAGRNVQSVQSGPVDSVYRNGTESLTHHSTSCMLVCCQSLLGLFSSQEIWGIYAYFTKNLSFISICLFAASLLKKLSEFLFLLCYQDFLWLFEGKAAACNVME